MMTSETALKWSIETDAQRNWHIIKEDSIGPTLIESLQEAVDMVDKPAHYTSDNIECIDYLKDNMPYEAFLGFLEGNTKKYLHRWRRKGKPVEDLSKSRWYLNRLIEELGGDEGA